MIAGLAREQLIANCFEACVFQLLRYPISLHLLSLSLRYRSTDQAVNVHGPMARDLCAHSLCIAVEERPAKGCGWVRDALRCPEHVDVLRCFGTSNRTNKSLGRYLLNV